MLFDVIRSGDFSLLTILPRIISSIIIIFFTLPMHEWGHAFVADKLGDPTPRYQGRLTLNPFAHIDYFGALMILLVGIGWAKPVQTNSRYFKNIKRDVALTAAAGPLMNIILAFIFMILSNLFYVLFNVSSANVTLYEVVYFIFIYYIRINIYLAVFNLIPIPPFDGSKILFSFLPTNLYIKVMQYERYFKLIVLLFLFSTIGSDILNNVSIFIENALWTIADLPFKSILG